MGIPNAKIDGMVIKSKNDTRCFYTGPINNQKAKRQTSKRRRRIDKQEIQISLDNKV